MNALMVALEPFEGVIDELPACMSPDLGQGALMPVDILAAAEQVAADYADRTDPASPRYRRLAARIVEIHEREAAKGEVLTADEWHALALRALLED